MTRKNQNLICCTIAALMWGPKTRADLIGEVSTHRSQIEGALKTLHYYGLIYRAGSIPPVMNADGNRKTGKWPVLWALNTKPFAEADRVTRHGTPIQESSTCSPPSQSPASRSPSTSATPSSPVRQPTPTGSCSTA